MSDEINLIRARLKCAAEWYPVHVGCGGECTPIRPDHDCYECERCERVVPFRDVVDPPCGDFYVRDVGRLLLLLDEAEVRAHNSMHEIEVAEIRGANWALNWTHHGASAAQICADERRAQQVAILEAMQ